MILTKILAKTGQFIGYLPVPGGGEKMDERWVETAPEKYHARDNAKPRLS
jgi:hypothetical protein